MDREWSDIIIVFVEDSLFLLVFKVIITIDYIYRLVKWGCLKSSSRDCSFVNNWRAWSGVQGCSEVSFKWVTSYVIDTCVKPFLLRTQCRLRMEPKHATFCATPFFKHLLACTKMFTVELMDVSRLWDLNEKKIGELLCLQIFVWSPRSAWGMA